MLKSSYINALYALGCNTPTTFCTTTDVNWNLGAWTARLNQGEPYTGPLLAQILHQVVPITRPTPSATHRRPPRC